MQSSLQTTSGTWRRSGSFGSLIGIRILWRVLASAVRPFCVEPGLLAKDARCFPTSSWWALETHLIMVRRGTGTRPNGGQDIGGDAIVDRAASAATGIFQRQPYTSREELTFKRGIYEAGPRRGCKGLHRHNEAFPQVCGSRSRPYLAEYGAYSGIRTQAPTRHGAKNIRIIGHFKLSNFVLYRYRTSTVLCIC